MKVFYLQIGNKVDDSDFGNSGKRCYAENCIVIMA